MTHSFSIRYPALSTLILTVLLCGRASANDTALGAVGGALQPMKQHPSIVMVSEDVRLKVGYTQNRPDGYVTVNCRFIFRNTGAPTTVKMGFPEDHEGEFSGFDYFKSKADGKPVPVRHVATRHGEYDPYRDWWVKEVRFDKGQTRIVEDSYAGPLGGASNGFQEAIYVLETGRPWRGRIGKAVVTAELPECRTALPSPKGFRWTGSTVQWVRTNWEPTPADNIHIELSRGYSNFVINGIDRTSEVMPLWNKSPFPARIENGILLVPANTLGNLMCMRTDSIGTKRPHEYHIRLSGSRTVDLRLVAGSTTAFIGDRKITLPKAPEIRRDPPFDESTLVVPFIPIAQAVGLTVTTNRKDGKTYIRTLSGDDEWMP